jgi:hypothetical protein
VTSRCRRQLPACVLHARDTLISFGIALLFAAAANGGVSVDDSYHSWQWGGFSRSEPSPTAPSPSYVDILSPNLSSSYLILTASANKWNPEIVSSADATTMLSGVVYFDANGDGIRDDSDWGVRDAIVSLTAANSNTQETTTTGTDGAYRFDNLAPDDYTVTLLTPSLQPEQPTLGSVTDAGGNLIATALGTASGASSVANIHLDSGNRATDYDFPQLTYPTNLLSKRMLIGSKPGLYHTTPGPTPPDPPPVSEPSTLVLLLAVAGVAAGHQFVQRRRRKSRQLPG